MLFKNRENHENYYKRQRKCMPEENLAAKSLLKIRILLPTSV